MKYCLWVSAQDTTGRALVHHILRSLNLRYEYSVIHKPQCRLSHVAFSFTGKCEMGLHVLSIFSPSGKMNLNVPYKHLQEIVITDEDPPKFRHLPIPRPCHSCRAEPGEPHKPGCDVEICSVCSGQKMLCGCTDHDPLFARWTGFWPGRLEATAFGMDLNELNKSHLGFLFTVKPKG